jgi:thiol-disulfide isomerase/thioredoxin
MTRKIALGAGLLVFFIAGLTFYYVTAKRHSANMAELRAAAPAPQSAASTIAVDTPANVSLLDFELPDVAGTMLSSTEWDGKARMLNFWATWCAPCRREIPLLMKTQDENGDNNVQVIGIAVDFPEEVAAYAEETGFNYPILVGQEDAMAIAEKSGVEFIGMPFTMIVAPSGELIKAHIGEIVESHIDEILHVFERMESGDLNVDGARDALSAL